MTRQFLITRIVICMILFLECMSLGTGCRQSGSTPEFMVFPVQEGDFTVTVRCEGVIVDKDETVVKPPVLGWMWRYTILDLVPDGSTVREGDILVQFDTAEVEKRKSEEETALANANAEFNKLLARQADTGEQLHADLLRASLDVELKQNQAKSMRFESTLKQEQVKLELFQAQLREKELKERCASQEKIDEQERKAQKLRIKQAEIKVNRSMEHIQKMTITAPKSGTAVLKESWHGKPEKGKSVGIWEPLMGITSMKDLQVECSVNEIDIEKVKKGLKARIVLESFPEKVFEGEVAEVAPLAKEEKNSNGIKTFQVYIKLKDEDPLIRPGYTTQVTIISRNINNTLYVPIESVFSLPETDEEPDDEKLLTTPSPAGAEPIDNMDEHLVKNDSDETGDENETTETVIAKNMLAYVLENHSPVKRDITVGAENDNFIVVVSGLRKGEHVLLRNPEVKLRSLGEEQNQEDTKTPE